MDCGLNGSIWMELRVGGQILFYGGFNLVRYLGVGLYKAFRIIMDGSLTPHFGSPFPSKIDLWTLSCDFALHK